MTTSNIHFGLAAWSANWVPDHAYSIGNRVSSSGNAYQAINAATSGATAPSGTGASFSDGAVNWKYLSAIDYTSIQAWANAIPTTLTSNIIGLLWNDATITTTVGNPFFVLGTSGAQRTTGGFTITLTPAIGESFRDKIKGTNTALAANAANGVTFQLPSSGTGGINYIDIYDSSFTLDGIQFIDPNSTSGSTIINSNANTITTLSHCIIDGYAQDGGASMVTSNAVMHYQNNLFIDRQAAGLNGVASGGGDGNVSTVVNNTYIRITPTNGSEAIASAFIANTSPSIVTNNIFVGYTYPVGGSGNQALVDHCAMTSATVGFSTDNGNNIYSITASNQFVSATTDFRLKYGSVALNAGVTDTTDAGTVDILGYARPQGTAWSLGAAEYVGQFKSTSSIGAVRSVGVISTVNNASASKLIGTISAVSTAQQITSASGTVSMGAVSAVITSIQSNVTSLTKSIGAIAAAAVISNNSVTATGSIVPRLIASALQFQTSSSTISIAPIAAVGTMRFSNITTSTSSMGPVASSGTAIQEDLASATSSIVFSSAGSNVSQSIVNASARISLPISAVSQANQFTTASSTRSVGTIAASSTAQQTDLTIGLASIGTLSSASSTMLQEDKQAGSGNLIISAVSTARQEKLLTSTTTLPISFFGAANTTYNVTSTASIGTISSVVAAGQSDLIAMVALIGTITTANTTATNPIFVTSTASLGPVSTGTSTFGAEDILSGLASIGTFVCRASGALLLAGTGKIGISSVAALANPIPATSLASIAPISVVAAFQNLTPLGASGTASMAPLSASGTAKQDDNISALISVIVTPLIVAANAPRLRVSQMPIETLASGSNIRVSQTSIEVLANGSNIRVSQAAIEILIKSVPPSAGRVSQVISEVLAIGTPRALASQVVQEVLTGGSNAQNVRMTQIVTETLTGGSTTQNVLMTQVVLETLISAVPLPTIGTTYIAI